MTLLDYERAKTLSRLEQVMLSNGDHVYVKSMKAGQAVKLVNGQNDAATSLGLLAVSLCDEDGTLLYKRPEEIQHIPWWIVQEIIPVVLRINGLEGDDAKN